MHSKKRIRVAHLALIATLIVLFIINMLTDAWVSGTAAFCSVALVLGGYLYLRSEHHSKGYPIESLIEKQGDTVVFHQLYGLDKPPLKVAKEDIYALNFDDHYLGVILNNNGRGFDFSYPHKAAMMQAHLKTLLGEEFYTQIKINP